MLVPLVLLSGSKLVNYAVGKKMHSGGLVRIFWYSGGFLAAVSNYLNTPKRKLGLRHDYFTVFLA